MNSRLLAVGRFRAHIYRLCVGIVISFAWRCRLSYGGIPAFYYRAFFYCCAVFPLSAACINVGITSLANTVFELSSMYMVGIALRM